MDINNKTDHFLRNIFLIQKINKSWYFLYFRSDSEQDPDSDPYQNKTDPQHCQTESCLFSPNSFNSFWHG